MCFESFSNTVLNIKPNSDYHVKKNHFHRQHSRSLPGLRSPRHNPVPMLASSWPSPSPPPPPPPRTPPSAIGAATRR